MQPEPTQAGPRRPDSAGTPGWRAALSAALAVAALVLGFIGLVAPAGADPGASGSPSPAASSTGATSSAPSPSAPGEEPSSPDPADPDPTEPGPTGPGTTEPGDPTTAPTEGPTSPDPVRHIDNAVFRWGVSNQTNARSHNPTAINFLSAGVANPGRGGATVTRGQWKARLGRVAVEKWSGTSWRPATWAGLGTSADGRPIEAAGPFSNHNVVIKGGTGSLDPTAGTGRIAWGGTFTVVYYGGNSIFTVTDPELVLSGGTGRLTAKLGGFAASQTDPTKWQPVPSRRVVVARLSKVDVGGDKGFTVTPDHLGVRVKGSVTQSGGAWFGAFPQPMIDFLAPMGIDQFWYSTGNDSYDEHKLPLPMSISYDASQTVDEPAPTGEPSGRPTVENSVNPHTDPPPDGSDVIPAPTEQDPAQQPPAPVPADLAPSVVEEMTPGVAADLRAVSATTDAGPVEGHRSRIWWIGGLLAALAALVLTWPVPAKRRT